MPIEAEKTVSPEGHGPGTLSCYEALYMALVLAEMVDERLCQHPAIAANAAWTLKAQTACDLLHELYQDIGRAHLP